MNKTLMVLAFVAAGACNRDEGLQASEQESLKSTESRVQAEERGAPEPGALQEPTTHAQAARPEGRDRDRARDPVREVDPPMTGMNDPALQGSLKADRDRQDAIREGTTQDDAAHADEPRPKNPRRIRPTQAEAERAAGATDDAEAERDQIATDAREELTRLDDRAASLQNKLEEADPEARERANSALAKVPAQRGAIETDLDALEQVREENLGRARSNLKKQLSALDRTLDTAESKL